MDKPLTISEANHINKLAENFLCAMFSDGKWWQIYNEDKENAVETAFKYAELFFEREKQTKKRIIRNEKDNVQR
jgi:hypothetical protein